MRSAGKPRVRGYHPSANDWTPLSRKPCWERRHPSLARLCSAVTLDYHAMALQTHAMGGRWASKPHADDLDGIGYRKRQSGLVATIR